MTSWNGNKTGVVLRPIIRERFSEEAMAAGELALHAGHFIKGREEYRARFNAPATSGKVISPSVGGGTFSPSSNSSPGGNIGSV